jgi:hypothetical protein
MSSNIIFAQSLKNKVILTLSGNSPFRIERLKKGVEGWQVWTADGFSDDEAAIPVAVPVGDILDNQGITDGLYTYRSVNFDKIDPLPKDYAYSNWVRCGSFGPVGYTFGNYKAAPGTWGNAITPDDLRNSYLWGTNFKASNGMDFTDEQIQFFIDASVSDLERRLHITIKKVRIRSNPEARHLEKNKDYDVEEGLYEFKYIKIQKYGLITTRHKPIIKLHKLTLLSRFTAAQELKDSTVVDKNKGMLKMLKRPMRPSETSFGIQTAVNMYGSELLNPFLFYEIDYDAGYETSDDIPMDLREAIGKNAAISLLNIIGDGLLSGFSSSSLSMDGMSEALSSTQSATSAYFGARIKVYQDELKDFIEDASRKFGHLQIGSI